jgi:hypothetical protein
MSENLWNTRGDGAAIALFGRFQLTVMTVGGLPRFLAHGADEMRDEVPRALLAPGTASTLAAAMRAAGACATRNELLFRRSPSQTEH